MCNVSPQFQPLTAGAVVDSLFAFVKPQQIDWIPNMTPRKYVSIISIPGQV